MRTTLDIDDDVLQIVKQRARRSRTSAGKVLSDLARTALEAETRDAAQEEDAFYGFRPLARKRGVVVTDEMIDALREDGPY
ncbi:MAG: antitoxin [Candidatus Dadabacteria bacterium]|nr:MAG: antitoxin [Candidatus Dadabacteria bacterium]